ncbi:MAG: V-type ATP synthase subunit E [Lentisphaeria bacterium]|nr:V-type ATP synthase subunit E [Lentisphaeria bacterium]
MDQEEKLREEMRKDAERKAGRAIDRAKREAEKLLTAVREEARTLKNNRLAAARETAEERKRAILAGIEHETRREELLGREQVIQDVLAASMKRAEDLTETLREKSLKALLQEAVAGLGGEAWVIRCAEADEERVKRLSAELPKACSVVADPAITGGVLVTDTAGMKSYDNTYTARLARSRDALRTDAYAMLMGKKQNQ